MVWTVCQSNFQYQNRRFFFMRSDVVISQWLEGKHRVIQIGYWTWLTGSFKSNVSHINTAIIRVTCMETNDVGEYLCVTTSSSVLRLKSIRLVILKDCCCNRFGPKFRTTIGEAPARHNGNKREWYSEQAAAARGDAREGQRKTKESCRLE